MKDRLPFRIGSVLILGFCLALTGCARAPAEAPAAAPVPVAVTATLGADIAFFQQRPLLFPYGNANPLFPVAMSATPRFRPSPPILRPQWPGTPGRGDFPCSGNGFAPPSS
jgi:hypothetical protein